MIFLIVLWSDSEINWNLKGREGKERKGKERKGREEKRREGKGREGKRKEEKRREGEVQVLVLPCPGGSSRPPPAPPSPG